MSAAFLQNLVSANLPALLTRTVNGECRLLAPADAESTDDRGFPNSDSVPRTSQFIGCSWSAKTNDKSNATEDIVAAQTRAGFVYEVIVTQTFAGVAVIAEPSDNLELRFVPGGETQMLKIVSVTNRQNVAWLIYAVDIEE